MFAASLAGCILLTTRRQELRLLSHRAEGLGVHRRRRDRLPGAFCRPPAAPRFMALACGRRACRDPRRCVSLQLRHALSLMARGGAGVRRDGGHLRPASPIRSRRSFAPARHTADGVDRARLLCVVPLALAAARAVRESTISGSATLRPICWLGLISLGLAAATHLSCRAADPALVPDAHETPGLAAGVGGHDHGDSHRRRGFPGLPGTRPQRRCRDRSGLRPEVGEALRLLRSDSAEC